MIEILLKTTGNCLTGTLLFKESWSLHYIQHRVDFSGYPVFLQWSFHDNSFYLDWIKMSQKSCLNHLSYRTLILSQDLLNPFKTILFCSNFMPIRLFLLSKSIFSHWIYTIRINIYPSHHFSHSIQHTVGIQNPLWMSDFIDD